MVPMLFLALLPLIRKSIMEPLESWYVCRVPSTSLLISVDSSPDHRFDLETSYLAHICMHGLSFIRIKYLGHMTNMTHFKMAAISIFSMSTSHTYAVSHRAFIFNTVHTKNRVTMIYTFKFICPNAKWPQVHEDPCSVITIHIRTQVVNRKH